MARENCKEKIFEFECPKRTMRESLQLLFDSLCLKFEIGIKRTGIVQLKRGIWSAMGLVLSSCFCTLQYVREEESLDLQKVKGKNRLTGKGAFCLFVYRES
ncbi:hypothetical protein QL285_051778 [Trifolium repens]|nr:hypothetical protein QL285_051778 [Trifolium repens]